VSKNEDHREFSGAHRDGEGEVVESGAECEVSEREKLVSELLHLTEELLISARAGFARRLEHRGLTLPQYFALMEIARLGPSVTMSRVAEATQLPASSLTGITDKLVERGYVKRAPHPTDRRAVVASLTPAGQQLLEDVQEAGRRETLDALVGIPDEDLRHFVRTFRLIYEHQQQRAKHHSDSKPASGAPSSSSPPDRST